MITTKRAATSNIEFKSHHSQKLKKFTSRFIILSTTNFLSQVAEKFSNRKSDRIAPTNWCICFQSLAMQVFVLIVIGVFFILGSSNAEDCLPRKFPDGIVCVCNSTYCDSIKVNVPVKGKFRSYTSSENGKRFFIEDGEFENVESNDIMVNLDTRTEYQTVTGFGGAFTDSVGINLKTLSAATQEQIMQSYFSTSGSRYSFGRVPVGGSDFSTRPYTLDDKPGDVYLTSFSLASEDEDYKIPYMKRALEINPQLRFIAASWTAPPWMKTNNDYRGIFGRLKKEFYQTYADYLIKFLENYKNQGLPIWAISTGNEPDDALLPFIPINDMLWFPKTVTEWVVENFGPAIEKSNSNETMILAMDDQRFNLPWYIDIMYKTNSSVDKYISGIAVHWYGDILAPVEVYSRTHEKYKNKFLIMTEACTGSIPFQRKVILGSWKRGERYIKSIIETMNNWNTGWIDWNLALDQKGGPNWAKNNVDSPIIVNPEKDEFFKQPMYYAIAHVSKFVPPGSVRISLSSISRSIKSMAFKTPDNEIVIILFNSDNSAKTVKINDPDQGNMNIHLDARSIQTIIYTQ